MVPDDFVTKERTFYSQVLLDLKMTKKSDTTIFNEKLYNIWIKYRFLCKRKCDFCLACAEKLISRSLTSLGRIVYVMYLKQPMDVYLEGHVPCSGVTYFYKPCSDIYWVHDQIIVYMAGTDKNCTSSYQYWFRFCF